MRVTAKLDPQQLDLSWPDLAVVLHLRHGAAVARAFAASGVTLVGGLSGTDLYEPPGIEDEVLESCRRIVALQPKAVERLPAPVRDRVQVIRQSALPGCGPEQPPTDRTRFCVLSHLRDVKDPFAPARALERMDPTVPAEVVHAGAVLDESLREEARRRSLATARWRWIGTLDRRASSALLRSSHVCIVPSRSEGGAGVISEAVVEGLALLASDADGNVGLLGANHAGLYPAGDDSSLARLMQRCALEPGFVTDLGNQSAALAPDFAPEVEVAAWRELLASVEAR